MGWLFVMTDQTETMPKNQSYLAGQSWTEPIFDRDRIHNQTDNPPSDAYIYR